MKLEFSYGESLDLENVCHVPNIRKNLFSTSLSDPHDYNILFASNKVAIGRHGLFL